MGSGATRIWHTDSSFFNRIPKPIPVQHRGQACLVIGAIRGSQLRVLIKNLATEKSEVIPFSTNSLGVSADDLRKIEKVANAESQRTKDIRKRGDYSHGDKLKLRRPGLL